MPLERPADVVSDRERRGGVVRVLVVEDSTADAGLVHTSLAKVWGDRVRTHHAVDLDAARAALTRRRPDCVLVDLGLPGCAGLDALVAVLEAAPGCPVVAVTEQDDEDLGVAAVRGGAQDYLVKGRIDAHLLERSLRYAIERRRADDLHLRLTAERLSRRQALQLNDEVVQRLIVAQYAAESGDETGLRDAVAATLDAARSMLADLMGGPDGAAPQPGELTRPAIPRAGPGPRGIVQVRGRAAAPPPADDPERVRVLLADDVADLRRAVRLRLEQSRRFAVVGEASTGREAVDLAQRCRPDLVVLDLSMPEMDGLEALPLILERAPASRVVVLSGFDAGTAGRVALAQGASAYVEKQSGLTGLVGRLLEVMAAPARAAAG